MHQTCSKLGCSSSSATGVPVHHIMIYDICETLSGSRGMKEVCLHWVLVNVGAGMTNMLCITGAIWIELSCRRLSSIPLASQTW